MKKHAAIILLPALLTSGCAELNRMRTPLNSAQPSTGVEEQALINNLFVAYSEDCPAAINQLRRLGGSSDDTSKALNGEVGSIIGKSSSSDTPEKKAARQAVIEKCSFKSEPSALSSETQAKIGIFVESGMTLSDIICEKFFRQVNNAARHRQFNRGVTNDVGGLVSTILGLAKAGSFATGGAGAAFALADSSFRNYDESFMVDPDLARLRRLVMAAQDNMRTKIRTARPTTFMGGETAIIRYAGLCSFLGMQDMLNNSVAHATADTEQDTKDTLSNTGSNPEEGSEANLREPAEPKSSPPATAPHASTLSITPPPPVPFSTSPKS